jgi:hypothetical protein
MVIMKVVQPISLNLRKKLITTGIRDNINLETFIHLTDDTRGVSK